MGPECPNCREPIPRLRLFVTTAWGRWECKRCGALLGVDKRRRLLATIPWIAILVLLLGVVRITSYGMPVAVPVLVAFGLCNYFIFDRAVVHERTGLRCRDCGYDLQGQVEARCPECGRVLDAGQVARLQNPERGFDERPVRRGLWFRDWGVIVVLSLLFIATVALLVFKRARKAAGVGPAPTAVTAPTRGAAPEVP